MQIHQENKLKKIGKNPKLVHHFSTWQERELQPDFDEEMERMLAETDKVVYQKGQQDALKDLPKWKKADTTMSCKGLICLSHGDMRFPHYANEILKGEYYLEFDDLEKLPKESLTYNSSFTDGKEHNPSFIE